MKLLKPARKETAFLKAAMYGLNGTGKTYSAWLIMMGLWHYAKKITGKKPGPIAFADTETGSDFILDRFRKEIKEIGLVVSKSIAFKDLLEICDEAKKECFGLIVDSVTHYWNEMLESYAKKHEIKRITLKHWLVLKPEWRRFSRERFVNYPLHMILCGRSADLWEEVLDEEGVEELKQKGTRMKAEGEMGHEANILLEMDLYRSGTSMEKQYVHRAWVRKDKFDRLNFKFFDEPKFEDFLPHIGRINIGGKHRPVDMKRTSEDMFRRGMGPGYQRMKMKEILLEKITSEIYKLYPGSDRQSKLGKIKIQEDIFHTNSWEEIKTFDIKKLDAGYQQLCKLSSKRR